MGFEEGELLVAFQIGEVGTELLVGRLVDPVQPEPIDRLVLRVGAGQRAVDVGHDSGITAADGVIGGPDLFRKCFEGWHLAR